MGETQHLVLVEQGEFRSRRQLRERESVGQGCIAQRQRRVSGTWHGVLPKAVCWMDGNVDLRLDEPMTDRRFRLLMGDDGCSRDRQQRLAPLTPTTNND